MPGLLGAVAIVLVFLLSGLKVLREYERAVVFRLGRLVGARGPGLVYVIPGIEKALRIDLRTITMDIPSQDVITKDNVSLKVNAVLYFRVIDSNRAVVEVENYLFATSQLAQTTLRSVCGEAQLDELLAEREKINAHLQSIIDQHTEPWGIKVVQVAVKHVVLAEAVRRARLPAARGADRAGARARACGGASARGRPRRRAPPPRARRRPACLPARRRRARPERHTRDPGSGVRAAAERRAPRAPLRRAARGGRRVGGARARRAAPRRAG